MVLRRACSPYPPARYRCPPTVPPVPPAQCRRWLLTPGPHVPAPSPLTTDGACSWLGYDLPVHASVLRCVSVHTCALAIISCVAATMCTLVPWWWDCGADDTLAHSSSGQNLAGLRCCPHVVLCGGRIPCVWDDDDRARHMLALLYDD